MTLFEDSFLVKDIITKSRYTVFYGRALKIAYCIPAQADIKNDPTLWYRFSTDTM